MYNVTQRTLMFILMPDSIPTQTADSQGLNHDCDTLQRHQPSHTRTVASTVKNSMEARSCNFRIVSYIFRKGKIMPPNFPKMEDYQCQNSWKSSKVARKLHSIAKIVRLRKNVKVAQLLRSATSQFSGGTS